MEYREFTGKTVDDAIIEAATTLGIASSELDIEVVNEGKSGFLGIGAKPAVIKARAKQEVKDDLDDMLAKAKKPGKTPKKAVAPVKKEEKAEVKENQPKVEAKKAEPKNDFKKSESNKSADDFDYADFEDDAKNEKPENLEPAVIDDSIIDETKSYLEKLFAAMEMEVTIDIQLDKVTRTMSIDVEGPEMGIIIGKRGQTLDSLQYLISLFVNKKSETYIRVKLDTENYRERRRETLENLAKNISFKVKRSRRPFSLEPMNPYERRIIHSTLQNDKYVTTKSEGEEPYRKVVVYPKRNNRRDYN